MRVLRGLARMGSNTGGRRPYGCLEADIIICSYGDNKDKAIVLQSG
jgi:hypothetical protein